MAEPHERRPMHVRCKPCGHVWVAAYLPMPADTFVKVVGRLMCPSCGAGAKKICMADDADTPAAGGGQT
jgi:Zn finger protein HypA/HybF involved in hydrogenase expression